MIISYMHFGVPTGAWKLGVAGDDAIDEDEEEGRSAIPLLLTNGWPKFWRVSGGM